MAIASGSTPTCGESSSIPEYELEAGQLRPPLPRRARSFLGPQNPAFPFPAVHTPSIASQHSPGAAPPPTLASSSSSTSSTTTITSDAHYERTVFDYRVLAQSMHAYRHLSIFRRFGRLSMANLLGYQAELTELEEGLRVLDSSRAPSADKEEEKKQKQKRRALMARLRRALKDYYEALLLQEQVFTSLEPPRPRDAKVLGEMAPPYPAAAAATPALPLDEHSDDLVALGGLKGRDSLEKVVGRVIPTLFPARNPSAQDLRMRVRSSKDIASLFSPFTRRVTRMLMALGTAVLMLGPMVLLRFVSSDVWTLVAIAGFTLALSVLVAVGTKGRGESIVGIIAAYAAVLVVFVQNEGVGCGGRV